MGLFAAIWAIIKLVVKLFLKFFLGFDIDLMTAVFDVGKALIG